MSTKDRDQSDERGKKIKRESDANSEMGKRHIIGTLNTITPCAACKLLRRRCAEDCPFSPYFSPHEPFKFAAVHKVFGASNVSKMLMDVQESQRADAANSLVYEANVRLRDPIYGCIGAISALQQEIQSLQAQLNAVRAEIMSYRYRESVSNNTSAASVSSTTIADIHRPQSLPLPLPQPPTPPRSSAVMFASSISSMNCSSISCGNIPYFD